MASIDWSFVFSSVTSGVVGAIAGFVLGFVGRKAFWRKSVSVGKWLSNSRMSFDLLAVRTYPPSQITSMNRNVTDRLRSLYGDLGIDSINENTIFFHVPILGKLRLRVDKIDDLAQDEVSATASPLVFKIKLTLKTDSPVNLGAREIGELGKFADYADKAFNAFEMFCFPKVPDTIKENYIIVDTERSTRFKEQDRFDVEDKKVGARIIGTPEKLEMMVSPVGKVVDATKKYRYA